MGPCGLEACITGSGSERGHFDGEEGEWLWCSWTSQEARMSINGTQKAFSEKMEGGEERKDRASLLAYLRRNMLEVTHVGSFYSFLPLMCWAGPEQAGVLFSCNETRWIRGSSPAAARLGPCPWREAGPGQ